MKLNSRLRSIFVILLFVTGLLYTTYIYSGMIVVSNFTSNNITDNLDTNDFTSSMISNFTFLNTSVVESNLSNMSFNIFMVETNEKSEYMNLKQLCSIESAALHNPEAIVHIKSLKARINDPLLEATYPNIKWSLMKVEDIFQDTPLESWWKNDKLTKSDDYFRFSHLSDALRITLLFKYGGFYSDLDHIAIKNFQPLIQFSALINNNNKTIDLESSFYHVSKNHSFLKMAIEEYARSYSPVEWAANGPGLLNRCIRKYCKTDKLDDLLINDHEVFNATKCDIGILPPFIAYPYVWSEAYKMFENDKQIEVKRFLRTYTIHFNTKVTKDYKIKWNEGTMMEFFMAHNCPLVYERIKHDVLKQKILY